MFKDFLILFFTLCSYGSLLFIGCNCGPLYWSYKRTKYSTPRHNCSFWHEIRSKIYRENDGITPKPIKETAPFVNTRCHCKNGGVCYNHGRCYCEFPYTGRYCEQIQQEKMQCLDPGFVNNADRFSNYGRPLLKERTFQVNDKILHVCHRGFVLNGPAYIICRESGSWSAPKPECVPSNQRSAIRPQVKTCTDPGFVNNSDRFLNSTGRPLVETETFKVNDTVFFNCHVGFMLVGMPYLQCLESSFWRGQLPRCLPLDEDLNPITCPDPGFVNNADRLSGDDSRPLSQTETFQVNDVVMFVCHTDFLLVGFRDTACLESGSWSNQLPVCEPSPQPLSEQGLVNTCSDPGFVPYARRTNGKGQLSTDEETYPVNEILIFECARNYTLIGASLIICLSNGSWSDSVPMCVIEMPNFEIKFPECCIEQGIETNANRVHWPVQRPIGSQCTTYHPGDVFEFTCNASDEFLLGKALTTCMSFGAWSDPVPMCLNYVDYWNTTFEDISYEELCPVFVRRQVNTSIVPTVQYDFGITLTYSQRAGRQQFPWIVALSNLTRNNWEVICSATLLNRNTALTAAHCVESLTTNGSRLNFGKYYRWDNNDDEFVQSARPTEFIIHPNYNNTSYDSDIAIIKFYPPVTYTRMVHPACLILPTIPLSENDFNETYFGVVAGWGVNERRILPGTLQFIWIPIVPSEICRNAFRRMNTNVTISSNMLCAGDREGAVGPCRADSGGGLFFPTEDQRSFVLVGIVSFGAYPECERTDRYDFFTNVANFVPWIEQYL